MGLRPTHVPVVWALLLTSGCVRGAEDDSHPAKDGPKPPAATVAPVAPDPELEALGLNVFGPHEHRGKHPEPHFRLESGRDWLGAGEEPPSPEKLERLRKMPGVVSVELKDGILPYTKTPGKYLLITKLIDLWSLADEKAWQREMAEKYLLLRDVGKHRWVKSSSAEEGRWPSTQAADRGRFVLAITAYAAPDQSMPQVAVFACQGESAGFEHEFWRWVLGHGEGKLRKLGQSYVFEHNEDGTEDGAIWATAEGVLVSISSAGKYPRGLVETYLEKHPSMLRADYRIDLEKWARDEMELRLARMDEALADAGGAAKRKLYFYNEWVALKRHFTFSFSGRTCQSSEEHRELRKQLGEWWEAGKAKLRWNRKTRKFEVKE